VLSQNLSGNEVTPNLGQIWGYFYG